MRRFFLLVICLTLALPGPAQTREDAFAQVLGTGAEGLVMEYWVTPDRLAHSQPLQLLAPEVYAKARTLVRDADVSGAFPILQCSTPQ
ncbi:MAG: hypothetical protein AAGM21_04820 [Pseudomonadota bacterium]